MFQLWKLLLLCGLLAGTSASFLEDLRGKLDNVFNKLKPDLEKGAETIDKALEGVFQKVKGDLKTIQDSEIWQQAKQKFQEAEKLVENALSKILPTVDGSLGLKISNGNIQDLKAELAPDGQGATLRIPITCTASVSLPVIGQVVDLKGSLELQTDVRVETDAQTGLPSVVLGECSDDSASISLTLLDNRSELVSRVVDSLTGVLSKAVSSLVQRQACPLIRVFLHSLDISSFDDLISKLEQGIQLPLDF
ncbi:BPI fold-containing family A member 2 isoform X1 [Equus caballus]|uniref:BPI fold-containing family A member 2 isoform X1 n=1 Tax=Equus caballus TaxID=9796 RepID=UPI0038B2EA65